MLKHIHSRLADHSKLYTRWHDFRFHPHIHWGIFGLFSVLTALKIIALVLSLSIALGPTTSALAATQTWTLAADWSGGSLSNAETSGDNLVLTSSLSPATPTLRASATANIGGASEITASKPTGTVENDLMFAIVTWSHGMFDIETTGPAGWTKLRDIYQSGGAQSGIFYKIAGGSEGANYTWTFSSGTDWSIVSISTFYNIDTVDPYDIDNYATASPGNVTAPSVSATNAGSLVIAAYSVANNAANPTWTAPSGTIEATEKNNGSNGGNEIAYKVQASAGASGTFVSDMNLSSYPELQGYTVVFNASASNAYNSPGTDTIQYNTGSENVMQSIAWNATTPAGTVVKARVRAAASQEGLAAATYSDYVTVSGNSFSGGNLIGQWAEVEWHLSTTDTSVTPTLADGTLTYVAANATPTVGSLGDTAYVNGSTGTDNTPTLGFTTADTDGNNVFYQIQIDDTEGFGSPVVDYTSASGVAGASSFTVGQPAGSGTYTTGSDGQTLTNTSYYWRVKVTDSNAAASDWSVANSPSVAFIVDVTLNHVHANYSTGNDTTGDGTTGNPYKTFHKAYTMVSDGGIINLTGTFDWANADETGDAATSGYTIAKNVTITGQLASNTYIQAASTAYTADRRVLTLSAGYTVTIQNVTIRYGQTSGDWEKSGIDSSATLTILNSVISDNANTSRFGGAPIGYSGSAKFVMRNSAVMNNNRDYDWDGYTGGIDAGGTNTGNEITNVTFYNNIGNYNGSIKVSTSNAKLTITNSTFYKNKGSVSSNDILAWSTGVQVYLKNNIFADALGTSHIVANSGSFVDGGYNIIESQDSAGFTNGVNGNLVGNQVNLNMDASAAINSSSYGVPTVALLEGSVAINAGDPNNADHNGITVPSADQRYYYRSGTTDIGAFEYGGSVAYSRPTVQAHTITPSSVAYNQMTLSWTNGNGQRRAVFVKQANTGTASPVDRTTYTASTTFGSGTQIGSSGWYAVYNGAGTTVTLTGLSRSTDYIAQVFEYSGASESELYFTSSASSNPLVQASSAVAEPTTQASEVTFSSVAYTTMTVSWTNGDGTSRAVFMKQANTGTASPVDDTTYTANTAFGSGTQIGSSGWYTIYNSTGTSVSVTGLTAETEYIVHVAEYNGTAGIENYFTNSATNNPKVQASATVAEPTTQASDITFSSVSYTSMTVSWTSGNGAKRAVFAKQASSGSAVPVDNTSYTASSSFGSGTQIGSSGWYTVYSSTGTSVTVSGLTASSDYSFHVVEYNESGSVKNYNASDGTNNPKVQSTTVVSEPTTQATNITFSSLAMTSMTVSWTNGNGGKRVVFAKQANTGTATPVDNTTYTASTTFGSGTQIGSSGWYTIYNNTGTSVSVTGLTAYTDYIFQVFDYNYSGSVSNYFVDAGTNNPLSQTTEATQPTTQATNIVFSSVASTTATVSWTSGNGSNRIVFVKQASTGTATPVDMTTYTANSAFGSGTQISTSGWYAVYSGSSNTFSLTGLTNNTGYIAQVFEYNGSTGTQNYYTSTGTNNPKTQTTLASYTFTYTAGAGGSITGSSPQTVDIGSSGSAVTAVPNTGYSFVNWSDSSVANPRTDSNAAGNISVTANFTINTYSLTYSAGANGTLTGTASQTVNYGANGSAITAVPASGYSFVNWSDSSTANPRTDSNVTTNVTVTANFADITGPSTPGIPSTDTPTSNSTPTWTWTASTDAGSGLTNPAYTVSWCETIGFTGCGGNTATTNTNSYTHAESLSDGTWYFRVISADVDSNNSSYSLKNTVIVDMTPPSDTGTPATATPTNSTTQTWLWDAATDAVSGILNYMWRITNSLGVGVSSGTTTSTSKTTTLGEGVWNFYVKARDNALNQGNEKNYTVTIDRTAPTISSIASTTTRTSATITWTTNEASSSRVNLGLITNYGTNTSEANTSTRVTSHSVTLSNLIACTKYNYRVRSRDSANNESVSTNQTFTTIGCIGSTPITNDFTANVPKDTGGEVSLVNESSKGIKLTVPRQFAGSDADFQIKNIDKASVISEASKPTNYNTVGDYVYELKAYTDTSTTVTDFDDSITITINYADEDVTSLDETTLKIYHYDGTSWTALTNNIVDTTAKTVTADTQSFSVFALFGQTPTTEENATTTTTSTTAPSSSTSSSNSVSTNTNSDSTSTTTTTALSTTTQPNKNKSSNSTTDPTIATTTNTDSNALDNLPDTTLEKEKLISSKAIVLLVLAVIAILLLVVLSVRKK